MTPLALQGVHGLDGRRQFCPAPAHSTIGRVKALDLSEYKTRLPSRKDQARARSTLVPPHVHEEVRGWREGGHCKSAGGQLRETEPPTGRTPSGPCAGTQHQEIRASYGRPNPATGRSRGREPCYIQACVGAPDDLISGEHLTDIRRAYAFGHDRPCRP